MADPLVTSRRRSAGFERMGGMRARVSGAAAAVAVATLALTACGPTMPETVLDGSSVSIGWHEELTSANSASRLGATAGNLDVAALTRGGFVQPTNDGYVADPGFGDVTIVEQEPFTVRYDLAETGWSDGVPVDAADLLLAWAAGSNALADPDVDPASLLAEDGTVELPEGVVWFDTVAGSLSQATTMPELDEFDRRIDVTFDTSVVDWESIVDIAVPAHVVGQLALGVDDPMAAKQAVIDAITTGSPEALSSIAQVWNTGFDLGAGADEALLVSSGPYLVESHGSSGVTLTPNPQFRGSLTAVFHTVELERIGTDEALAQLEDGTDVVQIIPTDENAAPVQELGFQGYSQFPSNTGSVWALVLRVDRGPFESAGARESFLMAAPASELTSAGASQWSNEYGTTGSILQQSGTQGYDMAMADPTIVESTAGSGDDEAANQARIDAGIPLDSVACVLFDPAQDYAARAFPVLEEAADAAGWDVVDCSDADFDTALAGGEWDAVLTTVPLPQSPGELAATWGTGGAGLLTGGGDPERDALIAAYAAAGTAEAYDANVALVAVEASIVASQVVLPLAPETLVTLSSDAVTGVEPRNGPAAQLTSTVLAWQPADA